MQLRPDRVVTPDDLARGKRALMKDAAWASLVGALSGSRSFPISATRLSSSLR
jgi:hypothetical protein